MFTVKSFKGAVIAAFFASLLPATAMETQKSEDHNILENQEPIVTSKQESIVTSKTDTQLIEEYFDSFAYRPKVPLLNEIISRTFGEGNFSKQLTQKILMTLYCLPIKTSFSPSLMNQMKNQAKNNKVSMLIYGNNRCAFSFHPMAGNLGKFEGFVIEKHKEEEKMCLRLYKKQEGMLHDSTMGSLTPILFRHISIDDKFIVGKTNLVSLMGEDTPVYNAKKIEDIEITLYR